MDFNSAFLPATLAWFFIFSAVVFIVGIVVKTNWRKLIEDRRTGLWFASVILLSLVWMIRASLESGLNIHLLGSMLITLMFGWRLGILAMSLVCVLVCLWGNGMPINLGLAIFINAFIAVSFCYFLFLLVESRMHQHLFIYLYATAFFGSAINYAVVGSISAVFLGIYGVFPWSVLTNDFLPYYYLMSFAEAFLNCGLITLAVVYRPQWLYSFRDEKYLDK